MHMRLYALYRALEEIFLWGSRVWLCGSVVVVGWRLFEKQWWRMPAWDPLLPVLFVAVIVVYLILIAGHHWFAIHFDVDIELDSPQKNEA